MLVNVAKHHGPTAGLCAVCRVLEDANHVFFRCPLARFAWSAVRAAANTSCPAYFRFIHEDLHPWRAAGGITRTMLDRALTTANFRLVIHVARKYQGYGLDIEDLVQVNFTLNIFFPRKEDQLITPKPMHPNILL